MTAPLVLKFGGELLETVEDRERLARLIASLSRTRPVIVVHGGGRAVDAELARRQIEPRKVDGLRITDAETLDAVVSVLGGSANTAFVAALVGQGVPAVGLTGVDAGLARATRTGAYRSSSGTTVDLGLVGDAVEADATLITHLTSRGYVPVVASLGVEGGTVLNINADVMACGLASAIAGCDLVIAGTTAGVLDASGRTIPELRAAGLDALVSDGTATAGMIAKLAACRAALSAGVASVRVIDGRGLETPRSLEEAPGTSIAPDAAGVPATAGRGALELV